jgi:valyl-tRNA synthetase
MTQEMDKRFDPKSYEGKWQAAWAAQRIFVCEAPSEKPSFCIMIPPPNVTGKLHIGHALQSTLQDVLTRWKRMQGFIALWLPGTDHAGIATQLMVERELAKEGTSKAELGRERFLERMWAWKEQYHGNIRRQLDLMGASCDWTRERFTMDEGLSRAVREAFVRLHEEGLITRGEYIVNWSPVLDTAISDLEVEMKTVKGKLYHIAYEVEGGVGPAERIVVATTRPETMLGDTAVAFHPDDERYAHLIGSAAVVPLAGRRIPFVADPAVDREFGTGLVKVTPAHDPFDFELGRRHGLPLVQVIDRHGRMTEAAGAEFAGLDRAEARRRVVERLGEDGHLVKVEDHVHNVGHSQRSGEPIEPLASTLWFCDVSGMAGKALGALDDGSLKLVPESWGKTWQHWLENIKPWCVSRQLWWGHQIPAWYDESGTCFVARSRAEAESLAGTAALTQDPDVLDTWFSSGLWPFSTLGWPDDTEDFRAFYPTDVLITGFDILFFWVARMVMMGYHFTGRTPFAWVHLTGLVRDASGQKMSKTKGNVVDPETLIDEHGADAMRFTLAILDSPGRDIPLDPERLAGYRAFGNKIWNATRFALSRVGGASVQRDIDPRALAVEERWILHRVSETADEVNKSLADFRFDLACDHLYQFFWADLCDWYIELSKPWLAGDAVAGSDRKAQVGQVLLTVLDRALRLLHPMMPFLTEELWQRLPGHQSIEARSICLAPYPAKEAAWEDLAAAESLTVLKGLITSVRNARLEARVPPKANVILHLSEFPSALAQLGESDLRRHLGGLARVTSLELEKPPGAWTGIVPHTDGRVKYAVRTETAITAAGSGNTARHQSQLAEIEESIARARAALDSPGFIEKAPAAVVEGRRRRLAELQSQREEILAGMQRS